MKWEMTKTTFKDEATTIEELNDVFLQLFTAEVITWYREILLHNSHFSWSMSQRYSYNSRNENRRF